MGFTSGGSRALMPGSFPACSCRQRSKLWKKVSLMFSKVCSISHASLHSPSPSPSPPHPPLPPFLTLHSLPTSVSKLCSHIVVTASEALMVYLHTAGPVVGRTASLQRTIWVHDTVNALCQSTHLLNIMFTQTHIQPCNRSDVRMHDHLHCAVMLPPSRIILASVG